MRGTLSDFLFHGCRDGIIPAHAGNTCRPVLTRERTRDHPRTCGEHFIIGARGLGKTGSSPHMRGTLDSNNGSVSQYGIIPAHAGNTSSRAKHIAGNRDHPRTCGEHLIKRHRMQTRSWIIPAHAGNTLKAMQTATQSGDHPRTCGEHSKRRLLTGIDAGSSPHMRGTQHPIGRVAVIPGIIPAHAGNTRIVTSTVSSPWDHPRTCGEHPSERRVMIP